MTFAAHRRLAAVLLALGLALGFTLVGAGTPAHANSTALTKVWNDTNYTIGVRFHTNWGTWADLNVGPHNWQGEVSGNMAYEPRYIHLGAGYCINYYYWVQGHNPGTTTSACGGASGGWANIYLGDAYTTNYDVHVTAVYEGYPSSLFQRHAAPRLVALRVA